MNKKDMRNNFRNSVFKRDKYTCVFCNEKQNLDAHHITDRHEMPNGGYVMENGITLCQKHHLECEQFHITNGESWIPCKHPNDLYKIIKSSKELAIKKSEELDNGNVG